MPGYSGIVLRTLLIIVLMNGIKNAVHSQKPDTTEAFRDIFADLPFDNPDANSKLSEGENTFEKIKRNIFVRPVLNKRRCYLGEPILLTINLWTRLHSTTAVTKRPYLAGFISTPVKVNSESPYFIKEKGKVYRVFKILQWQLIPTQAGILKIDPVRVDHNVIYKDDTGKEFTYNGKTETDSMNVIVDSLPSIGKPKDYPALTGNFSLTVFPVNDNLSAEKTNVLQVEVAGNGNYIQATLPEINWPAHIETFPVKERAEVISDSFPFTGRKIFEIPFIPHTQGDLQIPELKISFFNPFTKKFSVVKSALVVLHVLEPEINKPAENINTLSARTFEFKRSYFIYLFAGIAILVFLVLLFIINRKKNKRKEQQKQEKLAEEQKELQNQNTETEFDVELKKLIDNKDSRIFILAYKELMTGYLQAKTGTSVSSEEEIFKKIQVKDNLLAVQVWDIYKECNTLLYSAQSLSDDERQSMIATLGDVHKRVNIIWE